jgi:hypothetical protein
MQVLCFQSVYMNWLHKSIASSLANMPANKFITLLQTRGFNIQETHGGNVVISKPGVACKPTFSGRGIVPIGVIMQVCRCFKELCDL